MDEEHVLIAVRMPASNSCLHAGIRLLPLFLLLDGRMHHLQRTSPKFGMNNIHDRDLCLIAAPYCALGGSIGDLSILTGAWTRYTRTRIDGFDEHAGNRSRAGG